MAGAPIRSLKRATGFGIFLFTVTLWLWVPVIYHISNGYVDGLAIISPLFGLTTLQPFFLYRTLAALRVHSSHTDRLDKFFYRDRRGGLALIAVGLVCGLFALIMGIMIVTLMMFRTAHLLDPLRVIPLVGDFLTNFLWMTSPFVFAGLLVWSCITAGSGLWRIAAPRPPAASALRSSRARYPP